MRDFIDPTTRIKGRVRCFSVRDVAGVQSVLTGCRVPGEWTPKTRFRSNAVLYDWATIVGRLLTAGDNSMRIAGMYLEYQNVGGPAVPVSAPSFSRYDGISYYQSLASSSNSDFLRVPLVSTSLVSSNTSMFPQGNVASFFAQTVAGNGTGVNGKPFNDTAISKVYGGALVAMPAANDWSQDLIFSRFYFDTGSQQVKLSTSQLGLQWTLTLE